MLQTPVVKTTCDLRELELKDLLQSDCFVDKSLVIKDFLSTRIRITRVTAPRRFGKTVNLKMLKAFLQVENEPTTSNVTEGCRLFIKHNLNIFKLYKDFFYLHCGKYPVISVTIKNVIGDSFVDVVKAFKGVVRDSFLEHQYLQNSSRLDDMQKKQFSLYINETSYEHMHLETLLRSLVYLSKMLFLHFNRRVIVLIDQFDTCLLYTSRCV